MRRAIIGAIFIAVIAVLFFVFRGSEPERVQRVERDAPSTRSEAEISEATRDRPPAARRMIPAAARTSTDTRVVFGMITDPEGEPVIGATVRIVRRQSDEALVGKSGDRGEYVVLGVPGRVSRLEVSATGFTPQIFEEPSFPSSSRVRWDVVLEPARGVHGLVRCPEALADGARIWLSIPGNDRPIARTRADGEGRFALDVPDQAGFPLVIGAYHGQCGEGSVTASRPGGVVIELPGGGFVEGTVTDTEGRAIRSFAVSASSLGEESGGPGAQSFDDERGEFRLGPLAPGEQRVWVAAPGYRPARSERIELSPGETVAGLSFVLERSAELHGRVIDAVTRAPIEGALVTPSEWGAEALAESVGAFTGKDGRYVLKTVPGTRTTIQASAKGYRSLLHGGVEGSATRSIQLDFALTPVARDERPRRELIGIGAQLKKIDRGALVVGVVGGGAAEGRLQHGDVIVMVDQTPTANADFGDIIQKIRGETGTNVVLWVQRGGGGDPERVVLERGRVSMETH
jgi:hypothetical protein